MNNVSVLGAVIYRDGRVRDALRVIAAAVAGIVSMLTSLAGLPEVDET